MARILLAWEMGGDYGHLMRFRTLAHELARRGHEPILALRELTHVEAVLKDEPLPVYQAPVWFAHVSGLPPPIGFAETLMRIGFLHASSLTGICRAWRTLVRTLAPSLLVFDYAPTALLATRGLRTPRMLFGASFSMPPRTEPMPTYRWWRTDPAPRIVAAEGVVLRCANEVLARLREPPMHRLADLLDADDAIIASSPEFEQYPARIDGKYWGSVANVESGVPPDWPQVDGMRIFAYLKPGFRDLDKLLAALRRVDASVLVHVPGVAEKVVQSHASANLAFSREPVRMTDVLRDCCLVICHSGASTVETAVMAGKPVLLVPQHLEQLMTAKRVEALGAGLVADFEQPAPDYGHMLRRLLGEPSFAAAARDIAARHAGDDASARAARIADRCEALAAAREAAGAA